MRRSFLVDIATSSRLDLAPEELAEVERQYWLLTDGHRRTRRTIAVCVAAGLVAALIAVAVAVGLERQLSLGPPWSTVVRMVVASVAPLAFLVVAIVGVLGATRRDVRRALRRCGHDICEGCGYRLDGVPAGHPCSECGRREQAEPVGHPPASSG